MVFSSCYNFTDICVYRLNKYFDMMPCTNGGHLENCRTFDCNQMFKCQKSYCVHWIYVCDGKWDCPQGDDELNNNVCSGEKNCQLMYKCRGFKLKCISIGNVCNGQVDCPFHDDEMHCAFKKVTCPQNCNCLTFAITCSNIPIYILETISLRSFISIFIIASGITSLEIIQNKLVFTIFFQLPRNNISHICPVLILATIKLLDLQLNTLVEIKSKCFSKLIELNSLIISSNNIMFLYEKAFYNLKKLKFLNLSNNPFVNLPTKLFPHLQNLKILLINNMKLKYISLDSFFGSNIQVINAEDYHISCVAPRLSICTSHPPWYVSCSDILPGVFLKSIYTSISLLILFLNISSVCLQISEFKWNKSFSISVIGINISDSLCGVYLAIIWLSDIMFQGIYLANDELWKSHPLCFLSFAIVIFFTISNLFSLFFLSVTRFMIVLYPLDTKLKIWQNILYALGIIFVSSFIASLSLTVAFKDIEHHLPTSLCLPFIDPSGTVILTKVISWIFIVTQSTASITMVIMNIILVREINVSTKVVSKQTSSKVMTTQLIVTSTSNIICWFPINAIYISAMFLKMYHINLSIWATIVLFPINSIINPAVFISLNIRNCKTCKK